MKPKAQQVKPVRRTRGVRRTASGRAVIGLSNAPFADLLRPTLDPDFLAPPPPEGPADNVLLVGVENQPLTISWTISVDPASPGADDTFQLEFGTDPNNLVPYKLAQDIDDAQYQYGDVIDTLIDAIDRPGDPDTNSPPHDGSNVTYYVRGHYHLGPANEELYSDPISFIVDLVPPGYRTLTLTEPDIDPSIVASGLTDTILTVLGDKVDADIGVYGRETPGDVIWLYVDNERSLVSTPVAPGNNITSVEYPRELIARAGDGPRRAFRYQAQDRAGNVSPLSRPVYIDVQLAPIIPNLRKPTVPIFTANGIITDADARVPVLVEIPGNAAIADGDTIVVTWGTTELGEVDVPPGYAGEDPLFGPGGGVEVPYAVIQDELAPATRGTVDVTYEVITGSVSRGVSPPEQNVLVDLTLAGGVDPTPDDPKHGNLLPLTIRSMDPAAPPNVIPAGLTAQNATATIPWRGKDNTVVFALGDTIQVWWNGAAALTSPRPIEQSDIDADDELTLTVLGTVIDGENVGDKLVWYTVTHALVAPPPDQVNVSPAPDQTVEVRSTAELPGGLPGLDEGEYTERIKTNINYPEGVIGPNEARGGTPFLIPAYINKAAGDEIRLEVQPYIRNPLPGTKIGPPYVYTYTVKTGEELIDQELPLEQEMFFLPDYLAGRLGKSEAIYWVQSDKTTGKGVESKSIWISVDTRGVAP